MQEPARKRLSVLLVQTLLLFSASVYLLSLPAYYYLFAVANTGKLFFVSWVGNTINLNPVSLIDALLPYEAVFCLVLSVGFFAWFLHTFNQTIKLTRTKPI